jgi:hypothetical protein
MSDDKKQNFVQVNYDLLATKKLNSTQKLFISYIIGWQKNELICKESNKNLASRFGMKYSGIRGVLNELNKYDFFNAAQKDYNGENGTSGHEITVDEDELKLFLNDAEKEKDNSSTKPAAEPAAEPNAQSESLPEDATQDEMKIESEKNHPILQYHNSDVVNVKDTMIYLGFSNDEAEDFRAKIKKENVIFEKFMDSFFGITFTQKSNEYVGLRISDDQYELFTKMILDEIK